MKINPKFLSSDMTTDEELLDVTHKIGDIGEVLVKGSKVLSATDIYNGYFDLKYTAIPFTIRLYKGRLRLHETIDYTVSTVGDVTRITFIGVSASGGDEALVENDEMIYMYKFTYGDIMAVYKQYYKEITSGDIANNYVDLPNLSKNNSVISCIGRLGMFEGIDYDTSIVNGLTRITFKGDLLPAGATPLSVGNVVVFNYQL